MTTVFPANLLKSTITSARSAGASTICLSGTGMSNSTDLPSTI